MTRCKEPGVSQALNHGHARHSRYHACNVQLKHACAQGRVKLRRMRRMSSPRFSISWITLACRVARLCPNALLLGDEERTPLLNLGQQRDDAIARRGHGGLTVYVRPAGATHGSAVWNFPGSAVCNPEKIIRRTRHAMTGLAVASACTHGAPAVPVEIGRAGAGLGAGGRAAGGGRGRVQQALQRRERRGGVRGLCHGGRFVWRVVRGLQGGPGCSRKRLDAAEAAARTGWPRVNRLAMRGGCRR